MPSRHCESCDEFWPGHHLSCPVCKGKAEQSSVTPMDEHTYHWLLYVKRGGQLRAMPKSEQQKTEAEWDALEAEAVRRGSRWSVADLISDGFGLAA